MAATQLPPELEAHVAVITVSSSGVETRAARANPAVARAVGKYLSSLRLNASYYGRYYVVVHDGLDDHLYQQLKPFELPLLTVCKQVGQSNVFLLPTFSLFDGMEYAKLRSLRSVDAAFRTKAKKLVWYGGLSGPLTEANGRCAFVNLAPPILRQIGLPHDIRFTHLFGRDHLYRTEMGRYVPGHVGLERQIAHRYLVALDGNSYPSSLSWNLTARSLLFRQRSHWHCFLDDFFYAGVDYVDFGRDLADFESKVRFALQHEQEAERMVVSSTLKMRGVTRRFVEKYTLENLRKTLG